MEFNCNKNYSCVCDRTPHTATLKGKEHAAIWGCNCDGKSTVAACHVLASVKEERDEYWHSAHFLLFIHCSTSVSHSGSIFFFSQSILSAKTLIVTQSYISWCIYPYSSWKRLLTLTSTCLYVFSLHISVSSIKSEYWTLSMHVSFFYHTQACFFIPIPIITPCNH